MLFHTSDNFRDLLKADNFYFLKYRKYCARLIPNMSKFTWQHVLDSELYCRQKYFFLLLLKKQLWHLHCGKKMHAFMWFLQRPTQ